MTDLVKYSLYPIILNSTNFVAGSTSTFRYNFPSGNVDFKKSKVALADISIYYSWYNLTSSYNNVSFQIIFPTLAGSTTLSITVPNGFYDVSALNSYIQQQFISNGLYLVNASGNYVYYLELIENSNFYGVQLNSYPVPTALPAGYSNPAGMTFPAVATTPQLVVLSNSFRDVIGFNAGTYPNPVQATNYSKVSDYTPQVSPVQSMIVSCSLLTNKYASPNTILYAFSPAGVSFGNLIESKPVNFSYVSIKDGQYATFDVTLYDQSFNRLPINDTNLVIQLNIITED